MTEETQLNNKHQGPFELDLTEEYANEIKRSVQINMPSKGGVRQFNLDCWFDYGTIDEIRQQDDYSLMQSKLRRWSPSIKVSVQNPKTGQKEPRTLTSDDPENFEENRRLLLSIPWMLRPIALQWVNAIQGGGVDARKKGNS